MTQISAEPSTRYVIAAMSTRFGAYILDTILLTLSSILLGVLLLLTPAYLSLPITYLGDPLWFVLFWRLLSTTPGKLVCHLYVQPAAGPGRLSWAMILKRVGVQHVIPIALSTIVLLPASADELETMSVWVVLAAVLGLGWTLFDCLWAFGNPQRQALHDRFAGTVVVERIRR